MSVDADIALLNRLADAAGAAIRPHWRLAAAEWKADDSPVTVADRAAEAAMRAILEAERPGDGIEGEEYGVSRDGAARRWLLDPIDGTRAFIAGRPLFGVLAALVVDGAPVLGCICQPIIGERWVGAPGGTAFNGAPCRVRPCARLADAHLASTSPAAFPGATLAAFERVAADARDVLWGGDCHNYGLLAAGHLDLVIEAGLKPHDWAALLPVVAGAGGVMTGWSGEPLRLGCDGAVTAAGDSRTHAEALRRLRG